MDPHQPRPDADTAHLAPVPIATELLFRADGARLADVGTHKGETPDRALHLGAPRTDLPAVGEAVALELDWRREYNDERPHSSLGDLTPARVAAELETKTKKEVLLTADSNPKPY